MSEAAPESAPKRAYLDEIIATTGLYAGPDGFHDLLDFVSDKWQIAPYNALLLHIQNPHIIHVETVDGWRQFYQRRPIHEARPFLILQPFGPVSLVYDLADTEGRDVEDGALGPYPTLRQPRAPAVCRKMVGQETPGRVAIGTSQKPQHEGGASADRSKTNYDNLEVGRRGCGYTVTVKDVPLKGNGFWSITVYGEDNYLQPNDLNRNAHNKVTAEKNADGSITINAGGCDDGRINCSPITPDWNYVARTCMPSAQIVTGGWVFPEMQPVE